MKYWRCEGLDPSDASLNEAAAMLREGCVIAFPTETVYGLGADARKSSAIQKIFSSKGRPMDNPLIVHIASLAQMKEITLSADKVVAVLLDHFWPGPLTVILPLKPGSLSPLVTAGLDTVAVRMPDHPAALRLIEAAGCPLAGPSANSSGRPSPTTAGHVLEDLDGKIDGILDCGPTGVGVESTVVQYMLEDLSLHILRPGAVTKEQIRAVLPDIEVCDESALRTQTPRSPGMKYTHYAPSGTMTIVQGKDKEQVLAVIQKELDEAHARDERTGVLTYAEHANALRADHVVICGSLENLNTVAQGLYRTLREFDHADVTFIMAEGCPYDGIGDAIMNRMHKAAGGRMIHV